MSESMSNKKRFEVWGDASYSMGGDYAADSLDEAIDMFETELLSEHPNGNINIHVSREIVDD